MWFAFLNHPSLDSFLFSDNDDLYIKYYNLIEDENPGNEKRDGLCFCFKEYLPVRCRVNPYFKRSLIIEVSISNKRGYLVSIQRSPSQTSGIKQVITETVNILDNSLIVILVNQAR